MKVVLFCGGMGTRLRDYSETIPKPMVPVGYRPIMWHLMKYYAHFGHTEFILCLGYRADAIKDFFLHYDEAVSNDFVLSKGGRQIDLISSDIEDWTITFVDTGTHADLSDRLLAVRDLVAGEEMFMANYSDGLTDLDLNGYIETFRQSDAVAQMLAVQPPLSYHRVKTSDDGMVTDMTPIIGTDLWINGGFFVFRPEIFDYLRPGEDLVEGFNRLVPESRLRGLRYEGFWAPMDTFKDKQRLDDLYAKDQAPWQVWKTR